MRNLSKLILPAATLLAVCCMLASCQTGNTATSSDIRKTAKQIEADVCVDLALPIITPEQFNTAPQWVRDLIINQEAAWVQRCMK